MKSTFLFDCPFLKDIVKIDQMTVNQMFFGLLNDKLYNISDKLILLSQLR